MLTVSDLGLTREAVRRLLVSLITVEQAKRLESGAIPPDAAVDRVAFGLDAVALDDVTIDEGTLGFDSLARLDLILRVNRFFGLDRSGVEDYLLVHRRIGDWTDLVLKHGTLCDGKVDLTFHTSGSAGLPRAITHPIASLQAEVSALSKGPFSAFEPPSRVIALVPPHHIFGFLFTCLLPTSLGVEVIDLHRRAPTTAFRVARAGDLVIATPYIWDRLAQSDQRFSDAVRGVSSGGPASETTWSICKRAGLAHLTEVYGATETGGLGFRSHPDDPFALLDHLTTDGQKVIDKESGLRLDLQDRLSWVSDQHFKVLGRNDDAVQIAGVNVAPAHVKKVLSEIDGVADVAVRADKDNLRAFIVPTKAARSTNGAFEASLHREIRARLDPVARPSEITFGDIVPRNSMGKLTDWA